MRNRIVIMYKGREREAFAAEVINDLRDAEAFEAMEKKYPDADLMAIVDDVLFRKRHRPSAARLPKSEVDEFGPLKGTAAWDALPSNEKTAISKARNKAAKEKADISGEDKE